MLKQEQVLAVGMNESTGRSRYSQTENGNDLPRLETPSSAHCRVPLGLAAAWISVLAPLAASKLTNEFRHGCNLFISLAQGIRNIGVHGIFSCKEHQKGSQSIIFHPSDGISSRFSITRMQSNHRWLFLFDSGTKKVLNDTRNTAACRVPKREVRRVLERDSKMRETDTATLSNK